MSLRTRVRAPASVPFFPPAFFSPQLFLNVGVFAEILCTGTYSCISSEPQRSPHLLPFLRRGGQVRGTISSKQGRVRRVSRMHVPCVVRRVFFLLKTCNTYLVRSPLGPKYMPACVQLYTPSICQLVCNFGFVGVGSTLGKRYSCKRFSLPFIFVCLS